MKSTENINMDGIIPHDEILKTLKNFKQGSILESSYMRVQHVISSDMTAHLSPNDIKEISKREIIQKICSELLEKYKDSFEEEKVLFGTQLSLSMIVMNSGELKHIVEYCIRTMPQLAIEEIRK